MEEHFRSASKLPTAHFWYPLLCWALPDMAWLFYILAPQAKEASAKLTQLSTDTCGGLDTP